MKRNSSDGSRDSDSDLDIPRMTREEMRRGVMGKYATKAKGPTITLDSDLAAEFPDEGAVNNALRDFLRLRDVLAHITSGRRRKTA